MKFTIGFSPCPNDTFIFDALVNHKIDTDGFEFEAVMGDVQTLNKWAIDKKLAISKISYGVLPLVLNNYAVLNSGGALGKGVGPLLISKKMIEDFAEQMHKFSIAIPGENTTAHLLFSYAFPTAANKQFMIFHEIENAVLSGKVATGVIIHENRFTYQEKGLIKLSDLGEFWEQKTKAPIPLGGIVIDRNIDKAIQYKIDLLIRKSLEYSFSQYPILSPYITAHAQEMNEEVMRKHIDLYVNDFSLQLGETGKSAVYKLLEVYANINNIDLDTSNVFI